LRRKVVATVTLMIALTFGWAAVVVAVALAGAHDEARSSDAIAVLGAAQYNGRPSPVFRARLDHAAALYQRGLAPVVLVTGGVGSGDTVSESEVGRRYLLKAGLPEGAVVGLPAAASTSASLAGVAEWFSGKDNRRVLLVSDGFHMLRLRIIATRLGLQPFTSPAPNSPIRSNPRRHAPYFRTPPGFPDEVIPLDLASGLTAGEPSRERDEFIEVVPQPLSQVLARIRDGEVRDAKTIVAILYMAGFVLKM